jgi:beta-lactamase superfamily II metal-dependent hydrolase
LFEGAGAMSDNMKFTLWDVEHGLAIWIKTPTGRNHWIDAGHNNVTDFSPARHVAESYEEKSIDFLIISHPDKDHIEGLPELIKYFGKPRVILRNKTLPEADKFGDCTLEYQRIFRVLDSTYTHTVDKSMSPVNPDFNGGIEIKTFCLAYKEGMSKNNTSVVVFYLYAGWLFVCPGDIQESGWNDLWIKNQIAIEEIRAKAEKIVLVAPHHGRESGYYKLIFDNLKPHMVLVSDKYGKEPTDQRFYSVASGIAFDNGENISVLSTKTKNRIQITLESDGRAYFDYTR